MPRTLKVNYLVPIALVDYGSSDYSTEVVSTHCGTQQFARHELPVEGRKIPFLSVISRVVYDIDHDIRPCHRLVRIAVNYEEHHGVAAE